MNALCRATNNFLHDTHSLNSCFFNSLKFEVAPDIHPCISDKLSRSPPALQLPSDDLWSPDSLWSFLLPACHVVFLLCYLFLCFHLLPVLICSPGVFSWTMTVRVAIMLQTFRTFLCAHLGPQFDCLVQKENRLQWEFIFLLCTHSLASH